MNEKKTQENEPATNIAQSKEPLEQVSSIPTSRIGRFLQAGWAARHAIPLAIKRTAELGQRSNKPPESEEAPPDPSLLQHQEKIAEELFRTLGNLKGLAQKVGQMLSYLEGVLPADLAPIYQKILTRLQASAPALPPAAAQKAVEEDLDRLLDEIFADFEPEAFAAASIGQVHRARLPDGTRVAVKIQYPEIEKAVASDLKNMKTLSLLFAPLIRYYQGQDAIELARQQLLQELDYSREAHTQSRFSRLFEGHPFIQIPAILPSLCSKKGLTTEYIEGRTFQQILSAPQDQRDQYGKILFRYYWESIFFHHLVNSDPHPGNYIFLDGGRIAFLDFGAAVEIQPSFVRSFQRNVEAFLHHDDAAFRETVPETYGIPTKDETVFLAYCAAIHAFLEPFSPELQPFPFSVSWMEGYIDKALASASQILTRGGKIPRLPPPGSIPPDLPVIQRVGLGLSSLLAKLRACADWRLEAQAIFDRVPHTF